VEMLMLGLEMLPLHEFQQEKLQHRVL